MKDFNKAVQSFGKARQLDPKFFEAHMNYAAVNLSFRGFKEAEGAYRNALQFAPNDYEAHLGLALALRGQINDSNFDQAVAESQKHLDECKRIDPSRPEAYYNEAILTQEYRAKGEQASVIPMLDKAAEMYRQFVAKAGGDATYAEAVKRANDRKRDIEDIKKFIIEGEAAKKAEAEAAAAEAKAAAAAPPPAAAPATPAGGAAAPAGGKK
jgi:tetratricopeptide (TPR) repeat protein